MFLTSDLTASTLGTGATVDDVTYYVPFLDSVLTWGQLHDLTATVNASAPAPWGQFAGSFNCVPTVTPFGYTSINFEYSSEEERAWSDYWKIRIVTSASFRLAIVTDQQYCCAPYCSSYAYIQWFVSILFTSIYPHSYPCSCVNSLAWDGCDDIVTLLGLPTGTTAGDIATRRSIVCDYMRAMVVDHKNRIQDVFRVDDCGDPAGYYDDFDPSFCWGCGQSNLLCLDGCDPPGYKSYNPGVGSTAVWRPETGWVAGFASPVYNPATERYECTGIPQGCITLSGNV